MKIEIKRIELFDLAIESINSTTTFVENCELFIKNKYRLSKKEVFSKPFKETIRLFHIIFRKKYVDTYCYKKDLFLDKAKEWLHGYAFNVELSEQSNDPLWTIDSDNEKTPTKRSTAGSYI
jgi:hypothetical protein